jgi:outer membrane immunogenic protein
MVRKALLSSAGLMALSLQGASAQPLQAPVFSWTGAYVGVLAGAGFSDTRWTDVGLTTSPFYDPYAVPGGFRDVHSTGFVFGGFAGHNWQAMPGFVVGVEADLTYNTASGSALFNVIPRGFTAHANFAGSLRGRAGIAIDRLLLYVTGGLALGNPTARYFNADPGHWRHSGLRAGYVIGGGAEVMVTPNWTVRVEALIYNFGSANAVHTTPGDGDGYVMRVRTSQTQVRAGAAYRF